jgi:hypothetical protein
MCTVFRLSLLCGAFVMLVGPVRADLVVYTNRATFDAQGTIQFNSDFDDFGSGFSNPGDPFTRGGVTYTSGANLVVGTATGYAPIRNVITFNGWTPFTGTVDNTAEYSMFGFDFGSGGRTDPIDVVITTNLGSYSYNDIVVPNVNQGLAFRGFTTDQANEFITGFSLATTATGAFPGMTEVSVGLLSAVPAPAGVILAGVGVAGLGGLSWLRRRKTNLAV